MYASALPKRVAMQGSGWQELEGVTVGGVMVRWCSLCCRSMLGPMLRGKGRGGGRRTRLRGGVQVLDRIDY